MPKVNVAVPLDTDTEAVGDEPALRPDTLTAAPVTCCVASGLPVELLKPRTLPDRAALFGNVISILVGSSTGANNARLSRSSRSPISIVIVSKSASRLGAVMLPPAVYTLVREAGTSDRIVTTARFAGILPAVKTILPVPSVFKPAAFELSFTL